MKGKGGGPHRAGASPLHIMISFSAGSIPSMILSIIPQIKKR